MRERFKKTDWTKADRSHLKFGHPYLGQSRWSDPPTSQDLREMRRAWEDMGEEITAEYIRAHAGWRPAYWWLFKMEREKPEYSEQTEILREMGELSVEEERTIAQWEKKDE